MGHFKNSEHKKVGYFKKLARDQFLNRKGIEIEILRFWGYYFPYARMNPSDSLEPFENIKNVPVEVVEEQILLMDSIVNFLEFLFRFL